MAKKLNEIPEEGGYVNWDKFEKKAEEKPKKKKYKKAGKVVDEKVELSEKESASPYPDEFLADVNQLRKKMGIRDVRVDEIESIEGESLEAFLSKTGDFNDEEE